MIDILVYLFENYHQFSDCTKTRTLKRRLSAVGFQEEAIGAALRWLDGLKASPVIDGPRDHRSLRVYLPEEQAKLGHECLAFIGFLEASDMLLPALRELVVEGAMLLDENPVPLAKFKIIVLTILWSREQALEPLIVEELLDDGDGRLLH